MNTEYQHQSMLAWLTAVYLILTTTTRKTCITYNEALKIKLYFDNKEIARNQDYLTKIVQIKVEKWETKEAEK